jgi:DNA-binding LacI/PurR family transcriptional regulator
MNIKEIAKKANVSVATVSRVLNNPEKVKNDTKEKVLNIIKKYNYRPDAIAKSMRKKKTGIFSIVFSVHTDRIFETSYSQQLLQGTMSYMSKKGLKLIVDTHAQKDLLEYYGSMIDSKIVDGFILLDLQENDERIDFLNKQNFPYVVIGRNSKNNFNYIDSDNESGAFHAIEKFSKMGLKKILYLTGDKNNPVTEQRNKGVKNSARLNNVSIDMEYANFDEEKAIQIFKNKVRDSDFEGIFCVSDKMAIAVMQEMRKMKKYYPIIGFDNIELANFFDLTTVDQNIFEIGFNAAKNVHELSQGNKVNSIIIPTKLIERESTKKFKRG